MKTKDNIKIGDIVSLRTSCMWNGCSGIVHHVGQYVGVTMPNGTLKMAFGHHEIEKYSGVNQ